MEVGLARVSARFSSDAQASGRGVEAFAEAAALQLKGRRPIARKPSRASKRSREQHEQQAPDQAPAEQPLFIMEGSTGVLQVGGRDACTCAV